MAIDEDLSSPEEEAPPIKSARLVPEVMKQPKPLVSAKEIVLTESEEESDEPRVMEDEDVNMDQFTEPPTQDKKVFNNNVSLDELFKVPQKKEKKKKMKPAEDPIEAQPVEPSVKPAKKSGGLMLQFSPIPSPVPPPAAESPAIGERRDSKKKKKSKNRKESKETEAVVAVSGGKGSSGDQFTAISSLDAWLNSDSTGKVSIRSKFFATIFDNLSFEYNHFVLSTRSYTIISTTEGLTRVFLHVTVSCSVFLHRVVHWNPVGAHTLPKLLSKFAYI